MKKKIAVDPAMMEELVGALTVLLRKQDRQDEARVRLAAAQGSPLAVARVREWEREDGAIAVPEAMHDGAEIKTISDLAAAMGVSPWSAAVHVQAKGLSHPLFKEADKIVSNEFTGTAALMLVPRNAAKFAIDGGEPADKLHCTLLYVANVEALGKTQDEWVDYARSLQVPIIDASANGQTVFYNEPDKPVFVLNIDSPQLESVRSKVMADNQVAQTHGYTPHMTLKYLDKGDPVPAVARVPLQVVFDTLRVSYDGKHVDIPLVPAQTQDDVDIETKGIIRRVRTAAGVRRYGQPIGSIIVRDAPRINFSRDVPKELNNYWPTQTNGHLVKTDRYSVTLGKDAYFDQDILIIKDLVRGREVRVSAPDGVLRRTPRADGRPSRANSEESRKELAHLIAQNALPELNNPDATAYLGYEGVRGIDWLGDGDEDFIDPNDLEARWDRAYDDALELDTIVGVMPDVGSEDHVDVRVQEAINNSMRKYEEWYPGFSKYAVTSIVAGTGEDFLEQMEREGKQISPGERRVLNRAMALCEWKGVDNGARIMMNTDYYGEDSISTGANLSTRAAIREGWSSITVAALAAEMDIDHESAAAYMTFNHEVGHAITYQLKYDNYVVWFAFLEELNDYLKVNNMLDPNTGTLNVEEVTRQVSKYGATNLMELLAEVWASYVLSDSPTKVTDDIGQMLDRYFLEHWEHLLSTKGD